jgi:deferrochelatase/peroxidase EfeB
LANLDNVQAIVARSSARPFFAILLFQIVAPALARQFLREWKAAVLGGQAEEKAGDDVLHFMFSWRGLWKLLEGNPQFDLMQGARELEVFFVDPGQGPGSSAMAEQLGFVGDNAPDSWWEGFKSQDIELAVHGSFESQEQRTECLSRLRASAANQGLQELQLKSFADSALSGYRPPNGRLHFGYTDGITRPFVDWNDESIPGSVNFREFIVGYPSDDYPTPPQVPGIWQDFAREGSFACLTWLYQDVARFNAFLAENAPAAKPYAKAADPQEFLAAKLLGRWRNGAPLALYPDDQPADPELHKEFGYFDDPRGLKCPLSAHIRVVNSRDQGLDFRNSVMFPKGPPRLMRRGFSYGEPLEPLQSVEDDHQDRGVVGMFFCARVNQQFYMILRWIWNTDFSEAFMAIPNGLRAQDALLGARPDPPDPRSNTNLYIPQAGSGPLSLSLANFVRFRGVAVLFAPSLKALGILSSS